MYTQVYTHVCLTKHHSTGAHKSKRKYKYSDKFRCNADFAIQFGGQFYNQCDTLNLEFIFTDILLQILIIPREYRCDTTTAIELKVSVISTTGNIGDRSLSLSLPLCVFVPITRYVN